jgi:hypothetical protein
VVVFCFLVVEPQDIGFLPQSGSVLGSEVRHAGGCTNEELRCAVPGQPRWCISQLSTAAHVAHLGSWLHTCVLQEGSEPLTPRSEASDVSGMSAEARAYLERHLANIARGRGGLGPAHVQAHLGESSCMYLAGLHWAGLGWVLPRGRGGGALASLLRLALGPRPGWLQGGLADTRCLPACLACS